ncbi:MAG TPA: hypothetical protein VK906_00030 [Egicoccus sp.]|nr:hypothetical protein [Egicoccus sp.]HSK21526.1 hypothetical protein [Egicoccus sp.]
MSTVDQRAIEIGRRQRGRVTRRQLREDAGVSPWTITQRLRVGVWTEVLPNVIDLGTHSRTWRAQVLEVLLAAGPDAWVSHTTAAHLQAFLDVKRPSAIDVVVPRGRNARVGAQRLHTTTALGEDEVTERHGLACTTPARTLLDLAASVSAEVLERLIADQLRHDRSLVARLVELCDRHRRAPGRRRLLAVLDRLPEGAAELGSALEVVGVQRLRQLGAPPFELQYVVRDADGARIKRVDVAWPELRTILESDGAVYHDRLAQRREDERVRTRLRALGWHIVVVRRADLDSPEFASFVRGLAAA